ncbi:MAG: hypothetical protein ISR58_18190 [Anaerolineales bacterium]|nr:hypothetical protein [Chloroflexota bacterium]MBL6983109.1 hypothetical protein [Anaerolineales bacterium]
MVEDSVILHEILPDETAYQDALYEQFVLAFPDYARIFPSIRKDIQLGGDHNPNYLRHNWLILKKDIAVGLALFSYLIKSNIGFFRYLGVDPEHRYEGIGYNVIQELKKQFCIDAKIYGNPDPLGYCFEIESLAMAPNKREKEINQNRLDYFVNRGAIVLEVDYFEPVLASDEKLSEESAAEKPKPMHLLLQPIEKDLTRINPLTTRKLVAAVWFEHYGIDKDEPTAQLMLDSISD